MLGERAELLRCMKIELTKSGWTFQIGLGTEGVEARLLQTPLVTNLTVWPCVRKEIKHLRATEQLVQRVIEGLDVEGKLPVEKWEEFFDLVARLMRHRW